MKLNKNITNGALYLFGNLFNKAIAFLTVPILTRLMTTDEYGVLSTYNSWFVILSVIVGLSLGDTIRSAYVDYKDRLGEYMSSILFLALINTTLLFIIISGINGKAGFLDQRLVMLCIVQGFGTFVINAVIIKCVMEEKAFLRTIFLVLPEFFSAVVGIIVVYHMSDERYMGRIVPKCMIFSVFAFSLLLYYFLRYRQFVNIQCWKYAVPLALPLIFHGLSYNVLSTSDRSILTYYCGNSETGIYSLVSNFSMIAAVVTTSMENMWIPKFTRWMQKEAYDTVNQKAKIYVGAATMVFVILMLVAPELLTIIAPPEYLEGKYLIPPIILGSYFLFLYGVPVSAEYFFKKTRIIAVNTVIAAGTNLMLNFLLVPVFGAVAAAYTTVVSYVISFILHCRYMRKLNDRIFPFRLYCPFLGLMIAGTVVLYLTMNLWPVRWTISFVCAIIVFFAARKSRLI